MNLDPEQEFVELCAGSGAVSLELISRGHNPCKITMVDAGPWGDVWRLVGAGELDLRALEVVCGEAPVDMKDIPAFLTELRDEIGPKHPLAPYAFLLMQAASYGGKPIYDKEGRWATYGFNNDHWTPTPREMLRRVTNAVRRARGVTGIRGRVESMCVPANAVVYFDPPYAGTARYGSVSSGMLWGNPCYVSERVPLNDSARRLVDRRRSALTPVGDERAFEYLSLFNADWPTPDYERATQAELFPPLDLIGEER